MPTAPNRTSLAAALAVLVMMGGCDPSQANDRARVEGVGSDSLTLRYLGAAGWEISAPADDARGQVTVLVDPSAVTFALVRLRCCLTDWEHDGIVAVVMVPLRTCRRLASDAV